MPLVRAGVIALSLAVLLSGCAGGAKTRSKTGSTSAAIGQIAFVRLNDWDPESADSQGLFITDPRGSSVRKIDLPRGWQVGGVVWSPDGKELLVQGFVGNANSAIIRADGTVVRLLDPNDPAAFLFCEAWSADGATLLCRKDSDHHPEVEGIYSIRPDGTHLTRLTTPPYHSVTGAQGSCGGGDSQLDFSPNGEEFVLRRKRCGHGAQPWVDAKAALYVENTDGSGLHKIVDYGLVRPHAGTVDWSPDGKEILFGDDSGYLYTVHPDGSGLTQISVDTSKLVGFSPYAFLPAWSPDGRWILFSMGSANGTGLDRVALWWAKPDGSHLTKTIAGHPGIGNASWSQAGG